MGLRGSPWIPTYPVRGEHTSAIIELDADGQALSADRRLPLADDVLCHELKRSPAAGEDLALHDSVGRRESPTGGDAVDYGKTIAAGNPQTDLHGGQNRFANVAVVAAEGREVFFGEIRGEVGHQETLPQVRGRGRRGGPRSREGGATRSHRRRVRGAPTSSQYERTSLRLRGRSPKPLDNRRANTR